MGELHHSLTASLSSALEYAMVSPDFRWWTGLRLPYK